MRVGALRSYCDRYQLRPRHRAGKEELAELVAGHFAAQSSAQLTPLAERHMVTQFLQTLLRLGASFLSKYSKT